VLGSLTPEEIEKIIGDAGNNWISQRDHLLLGLLYNTGARVSEIIAVRIRDVVLAEAPCVHLRGKGRKQRSIPLRTSIVQEIKAWLRRNPSLGENNALLPNRTGTAMTRSNVTQRLQRAVHAASKQMDSLAKRTISPHTLRHSIAMHLLQSGTSIEVIALYLGHERPTTTHMYTEANMAMKEQALGRLQPSESKIARYRPPDTLLEFLKTL
jgi:site-specific recombinase XerD